MHLLVRSSIVLGAALFAACGDNALRGEPGFAVGEISGAATEAGASATFTFVLTGEPHRDVVIALSSSDVGEATVSPPTLTFTNVNWEAPQVVTVVGVDDAIADGPQTVTIVTAPSTSEDARYQGLEVPDVELSNGDNDTAGITVTPVSGLTTTEAGGQATFSIVLDTEPTADVTIGLTSSAVDEGTVGPAAVTFTPASWQSPQTITVTGVDDAVQDAAQVYSIVTAPAVSTDDRYDGLDAAEVAVTNTDDDTAGFTVSPTSGLSTDEAGGQATFTVALNAQPTADVTVTLTSSDTAEGTVSPASLTFTAANYNAPRTVTVTGVDDAVQDGNQPFSIVIGAATSSDPNYNAMNPPDVSLTNTDNDTAGFTVTPTSGLVTDEGGGQATFTVVLNSQPTADVTIDLTSSLVTEGTVSPASLTFTADDYNAPQTVTITGVDDDPAVQDGNRPYMIVTSAATSSDTNYNGMNPPDVSVTNNDNDTSAFDVTPTSGLVTSETAGQATFTIRLVTQPSGDVTIDLSSSAPDEGSVSPTTLTFTSDNFNAPQTVTVTGVDDAIADGAQPYSIVTAPASSSDQNYNNLDPADVSVSNTDDDSPGITVTPTSGLVTSESGMQAEFTVVLNSQPTADVTISLSSSKPGEGSVPSSVTFTPANFNAPQKVTITGVDDNPAVKDGNQLYTIITAPATSADPGYDGLDADDVDVTNLDNETPGFIVTPTSGLVTTESGGEATFTIVLTAKPSANVTINLSSNDTGEGTVTPPSVVFTPDNFASPQTVTVAGVNDAIADGDQPYSIVTSPAISTDPGYATLDPPNVGVTNTDDDSAGITLTPPALAITTEDGGTTTFAIRLNSQPTGDVTITLTSSDPGEGTVSPASLTFTAANFASDQIVTVTGVNDSLADGDQPYTIITSKASSSDSNYNDRDVPDVALTNHDNDSPGITVTPQTGLRTTEAGGTATFTIVLDSQPAQDVTIALSSDNTAEGTVSPASVTFTSANFASPQTVTVTGVDDVKADGDLPYRIITAAATSSDPQYDGLDAPDVDASNQDNDSPGITVTPTSGLITTEAGGTATFTIVLHSQPTADVTIDLSSSNTAEGTVSPASVTFTSDNFGAPQTVTITGVDDDPAVQDGNRAYEIVTAPAASNDPNYDDLNAANVSVTNNDNDTAAILVTPTSGLTTTEAGGQAAFTIVLTTQPAQDVTIAISSSDATEGTVDQMSVTFTSANFDVAQTITVTGVDDDVQDGNLNFTIVTAPATSSDPSYNGIDPANVAVTNIDNDTAGITVTPTSGLITTESGGEATFTVVLNSQPNGNVTIGISSGDLTEGTVSTAQLVFTPTNFAAPQEVRVTGVDDLFKDGNQPYTIITAPAISSDTAYNGLDASNVACTNQDND